MAGPVFWLLVIGAASALPVYDLSEHQWGSTETEASVAPLAFLALLALALGVARVARRRLGHALPESGAILLVGAAASGLLVLGGRSAAVSDRLLTFDPAFFFSGLLPPIIFNGAYHLHRSYFFANFFPIALFAVVGTAVSALLVALGVWGACAAAPAGACGDATLSLAEALAFGALISATDPVSVLAVFAELRVEPALFYLVFGESVVNDAVAIVLFETFSKFVGFEFGARAVLIAVADFALVFVGSMLLGGALGAAMAWALKRLRGRGAAGGDGGIDDDGGADGGADGAAARSAPHAELFEVAFYSLVTYLPFLAAETVELSGIVTTLFAAIAARHYAHANLSGPAAREAATSVFRVLAFLAESAVFLYLGLSVFALGYGAHYRATLIAAAVGACLAARAAHVYPLAFLVNRLAAPGDAAEPRIPTRTQHMLWFSGLRGVRVAEAVYRPFSPPPPPPQRLQAITRVRHRRSRSRARPTSRTRAATARTCS